VSPVFQKTVIHLHAPYKGKEFTIEAGPEPESNAYIQSVKVDGKAHAKNWIDFGDISRGGTMQFTLGSSPNQQWGAAAGDAPPSLSEQQQ